MRKLLFILISLSCICTQPVLAASLSLQSTSFTEDGDLPVLYTCQGKNVSPELEWKNAPVKTKSFTLIVTDPDAPGGTFYHWVVYNIPKTILRFGEGNTDVPVGGNTGLNSWKKATYKGPCPPSGNVHHYIFSVYALDAKLSLPLNAPVKDVLRAMKKHILAQAELTAHFGD